MNRLLPLFPEAAATIADRVDALFLFMIGVTGLLSLLIVLLIVTFSIRYRRRAPNEIGAPIATSVRLEALWIGFPLVIVMVMFGWGAQLFFEMRRPPEDALEIFILAKQWMWRAQHPTGNTELDELHVPAGRDVKLTMTSEDVIHSFFVPAFRIKADVLPGRYSTLWFHATRPGTYHLFCAEYCGTNHSRMVGSVTVMEPAEFEAWLAGDGSQGSLADAGARVFENMACARCHLESGAGRGPSLVAVYGRTIPLADGRTIVADANYIRESILNPAADVVAGYEPIMPSFQDLVSEQQLVELIAYIQSLQPAIEETER